MGNSPVCNCLNADPTPVCNAYGKQVAENRCLATCQQLPEKLFSELWCPDHSVHSTMCGCPETYQPVCDAYGKEVALNKCQAQCKGMTWGSIQAVGYCANSAGTPPSSEPTMETHSVDCGCADTYEPVCDVWGKEVARNKCEASCKQMVWGSIFAFSLCSSAREASPDAPLNFGESIEGAALLKDQDVTFDLADSLGTAESKPATESPAEAMTASSERKPAAFVQPPQKPEVGPCVCTMVFMPVCDSMGRQLASSPCHARCLGLSADSYSEDWCGNTGKTQERRDRVESCNCAGIGAPVCDRNGKQVAINRCNARCLGLRPDSFSVWNCYKPRYDDASDQDESSDEDESSDQADSSSEDDSEEVSSKPSPAVAWPSPDSNGEQTGQDYAYGAPAPAPALWQEFEWDAPLYLDNAEDGLLGGVEDELLEDEMLLPVDGILP